jgi:hypothetical protein
MAGRPGGGIPETDSVLSRIVAARLARYAEQFDDARVHEIRDSKPFWRFVVWASIFLGIAAFVAGMLLTGTAILVLGAAPAILALAVDRRTRPVSLSTPTVRAGVFHITFERHPVADGSYVVVPRNSMLIAARQSASVTAAKFPVLRQPKSVWERCESVIQTLASASPFLREDVKGDHAWAVPGEQSPIRETIPLFDVEWLAANQLSALVDDLSAVDQLDVNVPILAANDQVVQYLSADGIARPNDAPRYQKPVDELRAALGRLASQSAGDDWLLAAVDGISKQVAALAAARAASSCDVIQPAMRAIAEATKYNGFEFFCPTCNDRYTRDLSDRPVIEAADARPRERLNPSARVRLLADEPGWRCLVCEQDTLLPLVVPKLLAEVLQPAFDRLMTEHHGERLRTYNDVVNQKRQFANDAERDISAKKEAHGRHLGTLRASLAEHRARLEGAGQKLAVLKERLVSLEILSTSRVAQVYAYSDKLNADVAAGLRTFEERFSQRVNRIEGAATASMRKHASLAREEDQRRDAMMQQLVAASVRTAHNTGEVAAIQGAFAEKAGLNDPAPWNIAGQVERAASRAANTLAGGSEVDLARQRMAVR